MDTRLMVNFTIPMGNGLELDCEGVVLAQTKLKHDAATGGGCGGCSSGGGCGSGGCDEPHEYFVLETQEVVAVRGETRNPMPASYAVVECVTAPQGESALRAFHDRAELEAWLDRMEQRVPELTSALRAQMGTSAEQPTG